MHFVNTRSDKISSPNREPYKEFAGLLKIGLQNQDRGQGYMRQDQDLTSILRKTVHGWSAELGSC